MNNYTSGRMCNARKYPYFPPNGRCLTIERIYAQKLSSDFLGQFSFCWKVPEFLLVAFNSVKKIVLCFFKQTRNNLLLLSTFSHFQALCG